VNLLLWGLLAPQVALAQSTGTDLEYREPELGKKDKDTRLEVSGGFESEWHEYNDLDFRTLDESSDQAILDSDDRNSLAFTGAFLNLAYDIDKRTRFGVSASHRGLWGNDQIGNINRFGGLFYFTALFLQHEIPMGDRAVRVRVGREFYSIGGLGGARDYVLADVVDQVRVRIPLGGAGHLDVIPVGVMGSSSANDGANFVSFIGQSTTQTHGFRGDQMTRRHGGVLHLDELGPVNLSAYGFYTDIGALGSGSDISYNGRLGNFSDNDWVANFGLRAAAGLGVVTPYASVDLSRGIDRKELVAADIDTNGLAAGAGVILDTIDDGAKGKKKKKKKDPAGVRAEASFFQAQGGAYRDDGLQTSHGYTGMKARQVGGLLADRFMGWHPSAYVGMFGVSDDPHAVSRTSGTRVLHASVGGQLPVGLSATVSYWYLQDTGVSDLQLDKLDQIDPPFGYSREAFAAQERAGTVLGQEIDLDVAYQLSEALSLYGAGAVMLPGDFYAIPVARVAGDQLGSADPATPWAAMIGTKARF
jgi:hypothetical protein